MQNSTYDESQITIFDAKVHVRKRPGMYIGNLDAKGKKNLIFSLLELYISNSSDNTSLLEISLKKDDFVEISFSVNNTFEAFEKAFLESFNFNWFSVTNALSQYFEVKTADFIRIFEKGELLKQTDSITRTDRNTILFQLDKTIFEDISIPYEILFFPLKSLAFLNRNVGIIYKNEKLAFLTQNYFHYTEGVKDFLNELNLDTWYDKKFVFDFKETIEDISYEFSFIYFEYTDESQIFSFANNEQTKNHGSLVDGIVAGIIKTAKIIVNQHLELSTNFKKKKKFTFKKKNALKGLHLVASVKANELNYEGSTKEKLGTQIIYLDAQRLVFDRLYAHFTTRNAIKVGNYRSELDDFLRMFYEY